MSARLPHLPLLALVLGLALGTQVHAAEPPSAIETQSRALERASASVVGLRALAVDDARSAVTLGRSRQGSGVVIGPAAWC